MNEFKEKDINSTRMAIQLGAWEVGEQTYDEGWKIVTKEKLIGDEDSEKSCAWIAAVYDEFIAKHIVEMHNQWIEFFWNDHA